MHYYKFNIGDYASHTGHLDPLEDIAYRRMMDWCYLHETDLPDDIEQIAKLIRMRTHCECIASVLREFFVSNADGYFHKRVAEEINAACEKSGKARESANARWLKNKKKKKNANALRNECEGNATQDPLPTTQDPFKKKAAEKSTTITEDKFTDDDVELAAGMLDLIRALNPGHKAPDMSKWADTVRLMRERDSRTHQEIAALFQWANQDQFWKTNILSPAKLRDKWDTLIVQRDNPRQASQRETFDQIQARRRREEENTPFDQKVRRLT